MKKLLLSFCLLNFYGAQAQNAASPLWLRYPSISPDGKEVVFNYKGGLFKVATEGGTAVPLTLSASYNYKAVWSPDGQQIAFASDRTGNLDVFLMSAKGGAAKRLTTFSGGETPNSFTPDGKKVLFNATILDAASNTMFPNGTLPELYAVSVNGGRPEQILTTPAQEAVYDKASKRLLYQNRKGYENEWRKHHTSAIARDVMMYEPATGKHTYLTSFDGEDRNPVFASDEKSIYYLTEQYGAFNVARMSLDSKQITQITRHEKHPVRFLSIAQNDKICYSFNGELYVKEANGEPRKLNITLPYDFMGEEKEQKSISGGATEMSVSPNGKEVVFIERGEVFVTSVEYGITKQITRTPEQERNISFSPDGNAILYASERNGSWNIYQTKRVQANEKSFYNASLLKEEAVLATEAEEFQPQYSPDGKEVAFLEERVILRVINLATKQVRTIMGKEHNYSYSDGDQWYSWSPDSKWFLVNYATYHMFSPEVGLISADGKGKITNLTNSGYADGAPIWQADGKAMLWFSDRQGFRSHGSWGAEGDAYALFFTQDAYNQFTMTKEEYESWKDANKDKDKKEDKKDDKGKDKKAAAKDDKKDDKAVKPIEIDFDRLEDRRVRLTIHSSDLGGALLNKDATKLYYLSRFEKGYDLWVTDFKEKETKLLVKLDASSASMEMDSEKENLYVLAGGSISKITLSDGKKKPVSYNASMVLDKSAERVYMFEHAWRQVKKKFYDEKLHGVDWDFYKKEYATFLPHINNNYDFAEMLSELLGELNASHTGSGYRNSNPQSDNTASLGVFYDTNYKGAGLKIAEIMDKSPLFLAKKAIKAGDIIEKIDGVVITPETDYFPLLNRKVNKPVLLSLLSADNSRRDELIKPISIGAENMLLYERWVKKRREQVEKLSGGRLGYVHVEGMNSESFREVFSEVLGRYSDKEAIVIDTRFNGGGWLHDDLATFFSGKEYVTYSPRGQDFGHDPMSKWTKPSVLLVSESNYSDAHAFPYVYQTLGIGKIVGMPVPGTMTAVWWETLQDQSLYFGIPEVGAKDVRGKYLENQQLTPDIKVNNDYEEVIKGRDQQLEKAVQSLLEQLGAKK